MVTKIFSKMSLIVIPDGLDTFASPLGLLDSRNMPRSSRNREIVSLYGGLVVSKVETALRERISHPALKRVRLMSETGARYYGV